MRTMIVPVVHYADDEQALRNAARAFDAGCDGVLLIHMEGRNRLLPPIARVVKERWPDRLVGLNLLGAGAVEAIVAGLACGLDMTWTDEQLTHSGDAPWTEATEVVAMLRDHPGHVLLSGVAFKHQAHEPRPDVAARKAVELGFVPTTSGAATGVAAEASRVADLRAAIGPDAPLAIASGITPENVREYAPHLSHVLVATGVSSGFHELDPDRLSALREACRDD
jgi:predicted TIM-barrel enzyme